MADLRKCAGARSMLVAFAVWFFWSSLVVWAHLDPRPRVFMVVDSHHLYGRGLIEAELEGFEVIWPSENGKASTRAAPRLWFWTLGKMRRGDVLYIALGVHDADRLKPSRSFERSLRWMMAYAWVRGWRVVIATPMEVRPDVPRRVAKNVRIRELQSVSRALAADADVGCLDLGAIAPGLPGGFRADGVHWDSKRQGALAVVVGDRLAEVAGDRSLLCARRSFAKGEQS